MTTITSFINTLITAVDFPLLTAFLLGVLTSLSPCPLATNITAVAYISKEANSSNKTLLYGLIYSLGRGLSYTLVALIILVGFSSIDISRLFQKWGDKLLGPTLILLGLVLSGLIKPSAKKGSNHMQNLQRKLSTHGYLGAFGLGVLFALAFCPYSAVLFFGALMPLVLNAFAGLLLPVMYAVGTGLPVIFFAALIAFGLRRVNPCFQAVQKTERIMRYIVSTIFIGIGIYYFQYVF